ncbi:peptidoglycan recognition protein 1 [Aspergillus nanangensis]|uniref:Peptidoglycan recognition protein 1 n=1 Tax=Aspergillus nanangensis TaxID=2582783 RepID=A0AAD4CMM8_ASPNN|nr:peptidoglycan recognition protein 1 [Aspergillus nanangensis]
MASKFLTCLTALSSVALLPGVSAMRFVSREEWGASAPNGDYTSMGSAQGVKVHYLGPSFSGREHSECGAYMKEIQDMHMSNAAEGWMDIAYNMAVCEHGYVFDGRGKGHRSGANGDTQLNADHYAVLAFLAKEGVTEPTDEQVLGIQDAIAYLRRADAGDEIEGHKDGYSTECPGGALYAMVQDGSLDPGKLYDGGEHTVEEGETLDDLEATYNVPQAYIIEVNDLQSPYNLTAGDKLEIPARGVPLGESSGGGDSSYADFPGTAWFKDEPDSPIVKAMGERLVEEECDKYSSGPATQWSDEDLESYKCWQTKLGFTGADADGWPGESTWDKLKVPSS